MATLGTALDTARTLLNDDVKAVWSDAALIPKAAEAHRELQIKLWEVGSPVVREESAVLTVNSGVTDLTGVASYPLDILTPFKIMEWASGGNEVDAIEMTERAFIPRQTAQGTSLRYWAWRKEKIEVLGTSSGGRKVRIYYRRSLTIPDEVGDEIGVLWGEMYIGARCAAFAHGSLGNEEAYNIMSQLAEKNFSMVVGAQRGQQTPPEKP